MKNFCHFFFVLCWKEWKKKEFEYCWKIKKIWNENLFVGILFSYNFCSLWWICLRESRGRWGRIGWSISLNMKYRIHLDINQKSKKKKDLNHGKLSTTYRHLNKCITQLPTAQHNLTIKYVLLFQQPNLIYISSKCTLKLSYNWCVLGITTLNTANGKHIKTDNLKGKRKFVSRDMWWKISFYFYLYICYTFWSILWLGIIWTRICVWLISQFF